VNFARDDERVRVIYVSGVPSQYFGEYLTIEVVVKKVYTAFTHDPLATL